MTKATKDIAQGNGWKNLGEAGNTVIGADKLFSTRETAMTLEVLPDKVLVDGKTFSSTGIIPTIEEAKEFLADS